MIPLEIKAAILGAACLICIGSTWYACSQYYGARIDALLTANKAAKVLADNAAKTQRSISESQAAEAGVRAGAAAVVIDRQQGEISALTIKLDHTVASLAVAEQLYDNLVGRPANISAAPAKPMLDPPRASESCGSEADAAKWATAAAALNGTELSFCKGQLHEVVGLYNRNLKGVSK